MSTGQGCSSAEPNEPERYVRNGDEPSTVAVDVNDTLTFEKLDEPQAVKEDCVAAGLATYTLFVVVRKSDEKLLQPPIPEIVDAGDRKDKPCILNAAESTYRGDAGVIA